MIKTIAETIPLYDAHGVLMENQYLGMNSLYYIGSVLKTINKTIGDNFQNDPKGKLKDILEKLKSLKQIEYLGAVNSLYEYLYGRSGRIANTIKNIKLANPEIASSIIDIEALIAHSINNMAPSIYSTYSTSGNKITLDFEKMRKDADDLICKYDIRPAEPNILFGRMSGKKKKKVIVARELEKDHRFIIASQPTRGVDIGAIESIHNMILQEKTRGNAILVVSAELSEVMNLSDRIAVMFHGKIMDIIDRKDATEEKLGILMAGGRLNEK